MSNPDFGLRDKNIKVGKTNPMPKMQKMDAFSYTTWMNICGALGSVVGLFMLVIGVLSLFLDNDIETALFLTVVGAATFSVGVLQGTLVEISKSLHYLASKANQDERL